VSRFNLSDWALRNRSITLFLMACFVMAGLFAYQKLGRNEDPAFVFKSMVVSAAWPGATMEDTLSQLTERLERQLQETPSLDSLRSFTVPGQTTVFVNLDDATPAADVQTIWFKVRNLVGDIRHTLPQGTVGPFFDDRFGDTFGFIYGFTADGFTHRELRDHVEAVRSRLLRQQDVSKIIVLGAQDERILVEFSTADLASRGISRSAVVDALRAQNVVRPAGVIETADERMAVRVSGAFESEADLAEINLAVGDRMVRLADIATIRRAYADPPQPMFRVNGKEAIGLAIAMRDGGNILDLGERIRTAIAAEAEALPVGIDVTMVADQSRIVDTAIGEFMGSLWQAVGIILAVSFISLGVRPGLVVALAIPLTLAAVFAVMQVVGIDMQRISLGALIIALALLVDDAMTTTDAMVSRLAAGDPKHEAATFAYHRYAFAMLAGTLVTIAGFMPIGLAASSAGEYTFSLFAVVSIALLASWLIAVLFAPLIGTILLKAPDPAAANAPPGAVVATFRRVLDLAISFRWITLAITAGMFALSLLAMPLVPRQFFPSSDRPELLVDLQLPHNASIEASRALVSSVEARLREDPDVAHWSAYIGRGAIRFYLPLDARLPNPAFSQLVVVAEDVAARERLEERLALMLSREHPGVVARVSPLELGPPVGWPIQYRVDGRDAAEVRSQALKLAAAMATNPDVRRINFDWIEPARELRLDVDQDEARRLGLSSQAIAFVLNTVLSGEAVTQVRDDIYLVDVRVLARDEERVSIETLRSLQVQVPGGRTVPLSQFVRIGYAQDTPLLWREDRNPTLTVRADTAPGVLPQTVVDDLEATVGEVSAGLPPGYRIEVGGTVEASAESQASVVAVFPLMILVMLTVLMFQLKSFQRLIIVLAIAPLGLIGVVLALLLSGKPLGFVALLGILALIGIITKNAVILVDQIESERAAGRGVREAAVSAATARFRPIMLTALSTVLGMIPIAPTVFWGSMAFSVMGGLFVATALTLVLLPTLYVTWFERRGEGAEPTTVRAPAPAEEATP
jgi:multidrug efflux pump subunit AcrB